jgi:hypothetical protein
MAWAHGIAALPAQACAATRATARARLTDTFRNVDEALFERMTDVWFGRETQSVMRELVERLASRKR